MNDLTIINEHPEHQSMVQALVSAEIDQQIATAHKFPRSITTVVSNINALVSVSKEAAIECQFALPRGGKPITGPSIRFAEIVVSQWGNCRVGARVVHVDRVEGFVEAEGIFHDLQSNTATTERVRRRITDKYGKLYNDDMITMTGNAACSIAKRNAIIHGVPKAAWSQGYETAMQAARGDVKTMGERRDSLMKAMANFGLTPDQVCAIAGVKGEQDINLDELSLLQGVYQSLRSGEVQVEEYLKQIDGDVVDEKPAKGNISSAKPKADPKPKPKAEEKPKAKPKPKAEEKPKVDPKPKAEEKPKVDPKHAKWVEAIQKDIADAVKAADLNALEAVLDDHDLQLEALEKQAKPLHEDILGIFETARAELSESDDTPDQDEEGGADLSEEDQEVFDAIMMQVTSSDDVEALSEVLFFMAEDIKALCADNDATKQVIIKAVNDHLETLDGQPSWNDIEADGKTGLDVAFG